LNQRDWQPFAACLGLDPNLFHPHRGTIADLTPDGELQDTGIAEDVCSACPVRLPCLDHAMGETQGIWGAWRAESRAWVRRVDRPCPWCSWPIPRFVQTMFCSDDCLVAATRAGGEEAERIEKVLREMEENARLAIAQAKGRRMLKQVDPLAPQQGELMFDA
jgi:hypothetical protein